VGTINIEVNILLQQIVKRGKLEKKKKLDFDIKKQHITETLIITKINDFNKANKRDNLTHVKNYIKIKQREGVAFFG
jgi:hypothetical protein